MGSCQPAFSITKEALVRSFILCVSCSQVAIINYSFVPVEFRVLFVNVVALCWSAFLLVHAHMVVKAPGGGMSRVRQMSGGGTGIVDANVWSAAIGPAGPPSSHQLQGVDTKAIMSNGVPPEGSLKKDAHPPSPGAAELEGFGPSHDYGKES